MNCIAARLCAVTALASLLGGCVAVAALPVLAGGAMFAGGNVRIKAATPRPKKAAALAARPSSAERTGGMPIDVAAGTGVTLTGLTALPPPDAVAEAANPWKSFVSWSVARAERFKGDTSARSMIYEPGSSLALPRMLPCRAEVPAVLIDLDPAGATFTPTVGLTAAPGLAADLARVRAAGAAVVWITALPAARVGEVAEALRQSGLDPAGADPLLLDRGGGDRKQALRLDASRDVCVIAIAGDRKGDFDELFDYLRDPASGQSFDSYLGTGWFLTPPPLG